MGSATGGEIWNTRVAFGKKRLISGVSVSNGWMLRYSMFMREERVSLFVKVEKSEVANVPVFCNHLNS